MPSGLVPDDSVIISQPVPFVKRFLKFFYFSNSSQARDSRDRQQCYYSTAVPLCQVIFGKFLRKPDSSGSAAFSQQRKEFRLYAGPGTGLQRSTPLRQERSASLSSDSREAFGILSPGMPNANAHG
jgi:hypothetical protein